MAVGLRCLGYRLSVSTPNQIARPAALVNDLLTTRLSDLLSDLLPDLLSNLLSDLLFDLLSDLFQT